MKRIYYKTISETGFIDKPYTIKYFDTKEQAKEDALRDDWNNNFRLYEIKQCNKTTKIKYLGKLTCTYDIFYGDGTVK